MDRLVLGAPMPPLGSKVFFVTLNLARTSPDLLSLIAACQALSLSSTDDG
jgi:hypothetical protein